MTYGIGAYCNSCKQSLELCAKKKTSSVNQNYFLIIRSLPSYFVCIRFFIIYNNDKYNNKMLCFS